MRPRAIGNSHTHLIAVNLCFREMNRPTFRQTCRVPADSPHFLPCFPQIPHGPFPLFAPRRSGFADRPRRPHAKRPCICRFLVRFPFRTRHTPVSCDLSISLCCDCKVRAKWNRTVIGSSSDEMIQIVKPGRDDAGTIWSFRVRCRPFERPSRNLR
jgi:hypothetical protein